MIFHDTPRLRFKVSPLGEVTSQLSFPPILRIQAQDPVDFQDAIRAEFPFYAQEQAPPPKPTTGTAKVGQSITFNVGVPGKVHVFYGQEGSLFFRLYNNKLLFTSRKYDGWESFRDNVRKGLAALEKAYQPAFYSHVCVRYKNVILRSSLGLAERQWAQLLKPEILGVMANDEDSDLTEKYEHKFTLHLPDRTGRLDAVVGLGSNPNTTEKAMLLESHVYTDNQTRSSDVDTKLDSYRRAAGLFFRWCLKDTLRDALGPVVVAD